MAGLVLDAVAAGRRTERADGGGSAEAGFADSASTPMSTVQDRIWFMHELAGSNLYTVPTFLELDGPLDVDALGRALTVLLARHSILRTLYRASAGLPRPVSLPPEPVVLMTVPSTEEDAVVTAAQSRVFRLADEIPVDFRLVARSSGQHLLVAAFHHIAVDRVSLDLLFTELGVRYGEALRGTGPVDPLLEPAPRYSDHARAERDELATPVMQRRLRARAATVGAALADGGAALLARSGPAGRVGGYPLRLANGAIQLALPDAVGVDEAREINLSGQRADGIREIGPDGTVRFESWAAAVLYQETGYDGVEMPLDRAEDCARELAGRFAAYRGQVERNPGYQSVAGGRGRGTGTSELARASGTRTGADT